MAKRPKTPVDRESRFDIGELFFSTTDRTGKIQGGNSVFQRVARYTLEEMLGEPHSLVRHPDMPRVAYKVLWDYLLAGRPVVAYVKNMASDGSYYWVLATVVPIPGTDWFLSVRLKPTSPVFPVVQDLYARLLEIEREREAAGDRKGGLEASARALPGMLRDLGFADYDAFMRTVLPLEIRLRDQALEGSRDRVLVDEMRGRAAASTGEMAEAWCQSIALQEVLERQFQRLDAFVALSDGLDDKSRFVIELALNIRMVSLNAMLRSGRLDRAGAGLEAVSKAISALAADGERLAGAIGEGNEGAAQSLREAAFHIGLARLQMEMAVSFLQELTEGESSARNAASDAVALEGLRALLSALSASLSAVFNAYGEVSSRLAPLRDQIRRMQRLVGQLRTTHMAGKVEASRVRGGAAFQGYFGEMIDQVQLAHTELQDFSKAVEGTVKDLDLLALEEGSLQAGLSRITVRG